MSSLALESLLTPAQEDFKSLWKITFVKKFDDTGKLRGEYFLFHLTMAVPSSKHN